MKPLLRGRFAPSPSGYMHLGNAWAALLAWLGARSENGTMILRLEDLDEKRCRAELAEQLRQDLLWLGLTWDEESPPQSERGRAYAEAMEILRERGLVYPCWCSRADLHAAAAPQGEDGHSIYPGTCRSLSPKEASRRHTAPAWRLITPEREYAVEDHLQGRYGEILSQDCGDFVLQRRDGGWTYQLAVVVDDMASGVNQVARGRDLLSSTPRQLYLYELLGAEPPGYWHIPLILAPDGRRLSKREADMSIYSLSQRTTAPTVVGYLAHLAGFTDKPEPLTPQELLPLFSWERLVKEDVIAEGNSPLNTVP